MVFLNQDGSLLVEVNAVEISGDGKGYYLFGYVLNLTQPVKLGTFKSEEEAKLVLLRLAPSSVNQIPKAK